MHKLIFQGSKLAHASQPIFSAACKHVAYYSPPNVHIYTACWPNNYVVQLCPFWCNNYSARLSRLLTLLQVRTHHISQRLT